MSGGRITGLVSELLFLSSAILAQSDMATLSGRITDQSGRVLVGAQIIVSNIETGIGVTTTSNTDGIYVVADLRPGPYRIYVEKEGFRKVELKGLILNVQDSVGRNFTMQIGPIKETITITAGYDENKLSPAVSSVVDQQFVENIPLNGRSFQSLIELTPGIVVVPAGQAIEGQFSVNGQRSNTNYFTVDGVSANFSTNISVSLGQSFGGSLPALTVGGGTNSFVSVDAMQEFRIQTSTYAPEFGRSPGAQISIVTKSGTNQFHGTAYEYLRNDVFDARNWFDSPPLPKPPLRQNDFGGTFGGPIIKNRTFFFFSYEGLRLRQPQTAIADFYTPQARAAASSVYQPFVNALPIPNGPVADPSCDNVTTACYASLTGAYSEPSSFDGYSLRLDHTVKQRVTLFARYGHTPSVQGGPQFDNFANQEYDSLNTDTATAGATVTVSPTKLNDFRANWSRSRGRAILTLNNLDGAVPPPFTDLYRPGDSFERDQDVISFPDIDEGIYQGTRVANVQRQLNFVDTFSMSAGTHQFKFGVDFRRLEPTNQGDNGYALVLTNFSQVRSGTMGLV
ncbi:MAG TPA: carboxypeptidase regulatory-like domain-containing protein, partial [Terriglobales bacterium]|nr:carboxypeptidase regulatory-like domain-containing protein [Terriglobales bacterium]